MRYNGYHRFPGPIGERRVCSQDRLSMLLNLFLIGSIIVVQFQMLIQIRPRGHLDMLVLVSATIIAGWVAGGPAREKHKTLASTTGVRNAGGNGLRAVTDHFHGLGFSGVGPVDDS
jgi:hypothetical protein